MDNEQIVDLNLDDLPLNEIMIWKYIILEQEGLNAFKGYVGYKRAQMENYPPPYSDVLDEHILKAIRIYYPNASFIYNNLCSKSVEKVRLKHLYEKGLCDKFKVVVSPEFDVTSIYETGKKEKRNVEIELAFFIDLPRTTSMVPDIIKEARIDVSKSVAEEIFEKKNSLL